MKNPFKNIFKRNGGTEEQDPQASALLFGQYALNESSTSLSAFFAATELISNSVAQLPIKIMREHQIDSNHPLNSLFQNMLLNKFNFMKQLVTDVIIHGSAVAYIKRDPRNGQPIDLIYCEHGSYNVFYQQNKQLLYYLIPFCRKGRIEPVDVIHLYKNSTDGIIGKSLISYANRVLNLAKATDKAASKYYSSGCALQGALTIKGARKGAKEAARNAFAVTHNGDSGSGLVILDDDMSYTPLSSNANDSQMLEARSFNVQEIARYFNLNPLLLGDSTANAYKAIEEANIEFVSHTLMPYIKLFEYEFNRKLVLPSERKFIEINLDETYMLHGDKQSTANYYQTLVSSGILSINEAREQLGFQPVEGGDENMVLYSKTTDNMVSNNEQDDE